ncbi:MAG: methylenetetrahydrofolate reductase [NAD(P)H] [Ruminococcus sp.]|nr:methylenetetrahydrofolate reductase [NAD(P)H] [Ruminococcus sp.]
MEIKKLFDGEKTVFSMEIFPPKKPGTIDSIYSTLDGLSGIKPSFISCTYGAGGNPADTSTVDICRIIKEKYDILSIAHLTCVNNTKEDIDLAIELFKQSGIENVLALRGDINDKVEPKDDFKHASDLILYLREKAPWLEISAACYPETHPNSETAAEDIRYMKYKEECGAKHFMSQLFFDNSDFYRFRERAEIVGIKSPIEAGIMPVTSKAGILRMVSMCGASIPQKLARLLNKYEYNEEALKDACINYSIDQISDLIASGADGIHLYSMNKPDVAIRIYQAVKNLL